AVTHDTVTAMVREHMVEHGVVMWPFLVDSQSMPYEVNADMVRAKQFRYEATYDFTFANIEDPKDCLVIRIQAHAMDNADKAPGKAISYATKYAILKLFNLETGEDEESRFNQEGLEDDAFAGLLDAIHAATDEVALKKAYTVAFKTADAAKDKEAQKLIIKAKDARKAALAKEAA
ncbi:MAG: ERF family protein, partial [Pseudomonadota bacterium]|nr:ERF family protein [Pseudomonadota bacterium]